MKSKLIDKTNLKMYIAILDNVPDGLVPVISAHASLMCYLKYKENEAMQYWLKYSFKKVVISCSKDTLELMKLNVDYLEITESKLGNKLVGAVFCPRLEQWPKIFLGSKLWKPKSEN